MKISEKIRQLNGEEPDLALDDFQDIGQWSGMEYAATIAEEMEQTQLNENQQIVLDWFKTVADYHEEITPFDLIELAFSYERLSQSDVDLEDKATDLAFNVLNDKEQLEVLAAFAEWGMKEVSE